MRRNDRYTSLFWAALGLYVAFEGYRLNLGTLSQPGSGFLIFWSGIILFILSGLVFILAFSSIEEEKRIIWKGLQWPKGIKLMASLFLYALVVRRLGFLLATFLLLFYLFKALEPQRWRVAFLITGLTLVSCYLVFELVIQLQLPEGILEKAILHFNP